jgi:hypothetical protein
MQPQPFCNRAPAGASAPWDAARTQSEEFHRNTTIKTKNSPELSHEENYYRPFCIGIGRAFIRPVRGSKPHMLSRNSGMSDAVFGKDSN